MHHEIRAGNVAKVKELLNKNNGGGKLLAMGKNSMSRCALHIAVLRENEEMVRYIAKTYSETLRIGDNVRINSTNGKINFIFEVIAGQDSECPTFCFSWRELRCIMQWVYHQSKN